MLLFDNVTSVRFIERPNRFTLICYRSNGQKVSVYLPNPGRLWELLLPNTEILVTKSSNEKTKFKYLAVAVIRDGIPIMLHTHRTNDVAQHLIKQGKIPGLEGATIKKKEYTLGSSRFDFLIEINNREIVLEVKSCTLFSEHVAMFPDAVTDRGKRHLEELSRLEEAGRKGCVLFIVHWHRAQFFLPDYHTDPAFSQTFLEIRHKLKIIPYSVKWNHDLTLDNQGRVLTIPWHIVEQEAVDRGFCLFLLSIDNQISMEIEQNKKAIIKPGFCIFLEHVKSGLAKYIQKIKRQSKRSCNSMHFLISQANRITAIPIRTSEMLFPSIIEKLDFICDKKITAIRSYDDEFSHLYWCKKDPLKSKKFIRMLLYYRMDRVVRNEKDIENVINKQ